MPTDTQESDVTPEVKSLADAMRKGIALRPKRAHGVYFAGDDKSDALGAAYQGATGKANEDVHNHQVPGKLESWFPILGLNVQHPKTGERKTLKAVIRDLNDVQCWKRKNIARFVESVEARHAA